MLWKKVRKPVPFYSVPLCFLQVIENCGKNKQKNVAMSCLFNKRYTRIRSSLGIARVKLSLLIDDILVFLFLLSESFQDSSSSCCLDIPRQCLPQPIRNARDKPVLWRGVKQKNMRPTQLQQNLTISHSQGKRKIVGHSGDSRQQIVNDWKAYPGENSSISRI